MDYQQLYSLSIAVAAQAQEGTLSAENATKFCEHILPRLLVEIEVARRVDERISAMFPAPEPEVVAEQAPAPKKKPRRRKAAKGGAR